MAAPMQHTSNALPPDTLITIKVSVNENLKKLKLPLRDLTANVLPDKVSQAPAFRRREAAWPLSTPSPEQWW